MTKVVLVMNGMPLAARQAGSCCVFNFHWKERNSRSHFRSGIRGRRRAWSITLALSLCSESERVAFPCELSHYRNPCVRNCGSRSRKFPGGA